MAHVPPELVPEGLRLLGAVHHRVEGVIEVESAHRVIEPAAERIASAGASSSSSLARLLLQLRTELGKCLERRVTVEVDGHFSRHVGDDGGHVLEGGRVSAQLGRVVAERGRLAHELAVEASHLGLDELLRCATGGKRLDVVLVALEQVAHGGAVVNSGLRVALKLARRACLRLGEVGVDVGDFSPELGCSELVVVHLGDAQPVGAQRAVGGELVDFLLVLLSLFAKLVPLRDDLIHRRAGVEADRERAREHAREVLGVVGEQSNLLSGLLGSLGHARRAAAASAELVGEVASTVTGPLRDPLRLGGDVVVLRHAQRGVVGATADAEELVGEEPGANDQRSDAGADEGLPKEDKTSRSAPGSSLYAEQAGNQRTEAGGRCEPGGSRLRCRYTIREQRSIATQDHRAEDQHQAGHRDERGAERENVGCPLVTLEQLNQPEEHAVDGLHERRKRRHRAAGDGVHQAVDAVDENLPLGVDGLQRDFVLAVQLCALDEAALRVAHVVAEGIHVLSHAGKGVAHAKLREVQRVERLGDADRVQVVEAGEEALQHLCATTGSHHRLQLVSRNADEGCEVLEVLAAGGNGAAKGAEVGLQRAARALCGNAQRSQRSGEADDLVGREPGAGGERGDFSRHRENLCLRGVRLDRDIGQRRAEVLQVLRCEPGLGHEATEGLGDLVNRHARDRSEAGNGASKVDEVFLRDAHLVADGRDFRQLGEGERHLAGELHQAVADAVDCGCQLPGGELCRVEGALDVGECRLELSADDGGVDADARQRAADDHERVAHVVERVPLRDDAAIQVLRGGAHVALRSSHFLSRGGVLLEGLVGLLIARCVDAALARVADFIELLLRSRLLGDCLRQAITSCRLAPKLGSDLLVLVRVGRLIGGADVALKLLVELAALGHALQLVGEEADLLPLLLVRALALVNRAGCVRALGLPRDLSIFAECLDGLAESGYDSTVTLLVLGEVLVELLEALARANCCVGKLIELAPNSVGVLHIDRILDEALFNGHVSPRSSYRRS